MWEIFNTIKNGLIHWLVSHTYLDVYTTDAVLWAMSKSEIEARVNLIEKERQKYNCFTYDSYQKARKQEGKDLDYGC